ncbi:hypothetical protein COLO4_12770 [Corchorus olitorius]|uniref:Uncharacterized protein n=1 Tax=Corchorus olitorius TaxID=93759 RepID=A0A1R3K010_9ROSI|nr:hypothetical protein COLO4_12770 [Corchorus olitorius]
MALKQNIISSRYVKSSILEKSPPEIPGSCLI